MLKISNADSMQANDAKNRVNRMKKILNISDLYAVCLDIFGNVATTTDIPRCDILVCPMQANDANSTSPIATIRVHLNGSMHFNTPVQLAMIQLVCFDKKGTIKLLHTYILDKIEYMYPEKNLDIIFTIEY